MKQIRHPWDVWLKKKRFDLIRGRDYTGMPHSMSVQLRNAAIKRGLRVRVLIQEDTLKVIVLEESNG